MRTNTSLLDAERQDLWHQKSSTSRICQQKASLSVMSSRQASFSTTCSLAVQFSKEKSTTKFSAKTGSAYLTFKNRSIPKLTQEPSIYWPKCWKKIQINASLHRALCPIRISWAIWISSSRTRLFTRTVLFQDLTWKRNCKKSFVWARRNGSKSLSFSIITREKKELTYASDFLSFLLFYFYSVLIIIKNVLLSYSNSSKYD